MVHRLAIEARLVAKGAVKTGRCDAHGLGEFADRGARIAATQAALAHIPDGGRIITIGSNVGEHVPFAGLTVYAASKSALESFNRGLARELGPRGVTVNLVRPGPTDTDMNPAEGPLAETVLPFVPLGHYGRPEEIASAVAFLASPEAAYVTGAGLVVDGGANA